MMVKLFRSKNPLFFFFVGGEVALCVWMSGRWVGCMCVPDIPPILSPRYLITPAKPRK